MEQETSGRKEYLIGWLRRFGIIHGFVMIVLYLVYALARPGAQFPVSFLGGMVLFSLAGTLPGLICYSAREMSGREWWIRTAAHFLLLNVLEVPIARSIGLWQTAGEMWVFIGAVLLVDAAVHAVSFTMDCKTARDINRALKEQRDRKLNGDR